MSKDTQKRIIEGTLKAIANNGSVNVSIRDISSIASVNVASINYHFGSKEKLLEKVKNIIIKESSDHFSSVVASESNSREKLLDISLRLINIIHTFPGAFTLLNSIKDDKNDPLNREVSKLYYDYIDLIFKLISTIVKNKDKKYLENSLRIFIGAVLGPFLLYDKVGESKGYLKNEENHISYINQILDNL